MWAFPLPGGARLIIRTDTVSALQLIKRRQVPFEDPKPALQEAAGILRRSYARQFASGGRPAWTPLSPFTIARKRAMGVPKRTAKGNIPKRLVQNGNFDATNILIAKGTLRDSYVQLGARGHVETFTAFGVSIGSQLKTPDGKYSLAAIHQFGATIRGRRRLRPQRRSLHANVQQSGGGITIPARPLRVQDEDRTAIVAAFRRYFGSGR